MAHVHDIYLKQEVTSNSPLDVLDFSMSEGGNSNNKFSSENGQESLYHQLLHNTAKVSTKYVGHNGEKLSSSEADRMESNSSDSPQHTTSPPSKTYECPYCDYKSTRSFNLTNHLQTHYLEKPYADPACTYCATLNNYKIDRMSSNHDNNMHPCGHCSLFSSTVEEAVQHLKTHLDETSCICAPRSEANDPEDVYKSETKVFPVKEEFQKNKIFQCPECDYTAKRAQNLKRHAITHSGERPHCCGTCAYRAPDVSSLKVHMKTHTGERPYPCPHCSYKASQKSTLRNHLKVHTGEKPFACPHCSYKSSNQTNLSSHVKTHTGEKPYSCPQCAYCATQSSALKCHLRTHTGEKPFTCSECSYKAAALGNLRSHLKVHVNQ